MSKHGGDKKRQSRATPPNREGDKGRTWIRAGQDSEPERCRIIRHSPPPRRVASSPPSRSPSGPTRIGRLGGSRRGPTGRTGSRPIGSCKMRSNTPPSKTYQKQSNMAEIGKSVDWTPSPTDSPRSAARRASSARAHPRGRSRGRPREAEESEEARMPGRRIGSGWWTSAVATSRPGGKASDLHRTRHARAPKTRREPYGDSVRGTSGKRRTRRRTALDAQRQGRRGDRLLGFEPGLVHRFQRHPQRGLLPDH